MITRKYNLINNVTGWIVFVIALVTYWLTLEPTASYWDCGEFIIQADKLEVGHPPGNPIFMLTARFFSNFATDAGSVSLMVNAMSGLLSALTILLLFWTITHLVRRLVVRDNQDGELSLTKYLIIIGSGVVGALAYTWSDTFWFSAVEGEVYAFSSFCTALVFWLILKWENRADQPDSDRYLILIAYVIGVSIAVHLLNLLCIPAIVLVFAYRKWKDMNLVKSLIALGISFLIIALVLFGLVPGFIKIAQWFELLFVNSFGMSFNSGALFYGFLMLCMFIWGIYEFQSKKSWMRMRLSFLLCIFFSGMLFITSGAWFGWLLSVVLSIFLYSPYCKKEMARAFNVILWSIAVIFIGYSSYALILIRSSADTPMNQNSPDNVFDLASYLNREQYGETPLLYGQTLFSGQQKSQVDVRVDSIAQGGQVYYVQTPLYNPIINKGTAQYSKGVKGAEPLSEYGFLNEKEKAKNQKLAARGGDYYVKSDYKPETKFNPELNMFFPRIYSRAHQAAYNVWVNLDTVPGNLKEIWAVDEMTGEKVPEVDQYGEPFMAPSGLVTFPQKVGYRPTYAQNLAYFFNYQLIHMYMRYFMWNFAGRQNDVLNQQGELDAGNWISGIPFIDNARLGDQSLLPDELGKNNPGHNKFYLLPLLLGLMGLIWQAFAGKRGVEQFWVVFFLFFMTGIAIVLYLNQPPMQPRERDYAFAGSFYAYAIWIGMGVAGLWQLVTIVLGKAQKPDVTDAEGKPEGNEDTEPLLNTVAKESAMPLNNGEELEQNPNLTEENPKNSKLNLYAAVVAVVLGLVIPIQMVSQTWDDHDRSRRTAMRDFAINYLESLEPNAIIFCNGDNDTFPLWYAQEVEGIRPDVKIINLSYLASEWYANQMRQQSYSAAPVDFTAQPKDYAYGNLDIVLPGTEKAPTDLLQSLKYIYSGKGRDNSTGYPMLPSSVVTIPVNKEAVVKRGLVSPADTANLVDKIVIDLANTEGFKSKNYISLSELLMLDIVATNAANGWPRPIYWCMTVGDEYHLGLTDYMKSVGMTHQLLPTRQTGLPARTDKGYDIVMKYLWGGADNDNPPYYDETARRMLISTRTSMLAVAEQLIREGDALKEKGNESAASDKFKKALNVLNLMDSKLRQSTWPYSMGIALDLPKLYWTAGTGLNDAKAKQKALQLVEQSLKRYAPYLAYSADVRRRFGNVTLSPESGYSMYQYYALIKMFNEYGGTSKTLQSILKPTGYTVDQLKKYYDMVYGDRAGVDEPLSEDQINSELASVITLVRKAEGLSPEDYAKQSEEEKLYDTLFYEIYKEYSEQLDQMFKDDKNKVNLKRSKRLYDEYLENHPQYK